jgi:hypothetical protein
MNNKQPTAQGFARAPASQAHRLFTPRGLHLGRPRDSYTANAFMQARAPTVLPQIMPVHDADTENRHSDAVLTCAYCKLS